MFKFRARNIFLILFCLNFFLLQNIYTQDAIDPNQDTDVDLAIRKVLVWKGEITGIYDRKTQLKIMIHRNQSIPYSLPDRNSLKKEILSQQWTVYQKKTKKELAVFYPRDLIWEKNLKQSKENAYTVSIWGELVATDQKSLSLIISGSYIAKYKEEKSFIEPNEYFLKNKKSLPKKIKHSKDRKEMLLVDRGIFLYGQGTDSTEASFNSEFFQPNLGNLIEIAPFYMDKYEVTNEEYNLYLKETNSKPPAHWENGIIPEGKESHPVNFLSYKEVQGYANWSGKRIPTELEWEKAARGAGVEIYQNRDETLSYYIQTISYPFGNEFDAKLCNTFESGINSTVSVYEIPTSSASPYGIIGMCGNVAEWTNSFYTAYSNQPFTLKGYGKVYKVIRGGSYLENSQNARVFHRSYGGNPNLLEDRRAGFRLITDYKP